MCWAMAISPGLGVSLSAVFGRLAGEAAARQARRRNGYLKRSAGRLEPLPCRFVGRKPEPIAPRCAGKAAHQNSGAGEMIEQVDSIATLRTARKDRCRRAISVPLGRARRRAAFDRPPSRVRVAAIHAVSRSAAVAISHAGPDTGQSPSNDARPWHPVRWRRQNPRASRRGQRTCQASAARWCPQAIPATPASTVSGCTSAKASSTISRRPLAVQACANAARSARAMTRPSGLLGLTTIERSQDRAAPDPATRSSSCTSAPASRQACACEP